MANPNTNAEDKGLKVTSVNSANNKALTSEEKAYYGDSNNYEKNAVDVFLNENLVTKSESQANEIIYPDRTKEAVRNNTMSMPNGATIRNLSDNAITLYETDYTARDDVSSDIRY